MIRATAGATLLGMDDRTPPQLDMHIDGSFTAPARSRLLTRVFIWATVVAVLAGGVAIAAVALSLALFLVPIALAAGVIAWAALRFQLWRAQRAAGRRRDLWRQG